MNNIDNLRTRIEKFINEYETDGPKKEGLGPKEAANRLSSFKTD